MMKKLCICFIGYLVISSGFQAQAIPNENEILDFEKTQGAPEIILTVEKVTGVYVDFGFNGYLMNLQPDTQVRLLAYHPTQYLIQCTKPSCKGWIDSASVTPIKPDVIEAFKASLAEDKTFADAIKKKQILPNMTPRHVLQALGEPTQKSLNTDTGGSFEIWSYITKEKIYETIYVPTTIQRPNGTYITANAPVRREVGERVISSLTIQFKNGRVVSLQQNKEQNTSSSKSKTIPDQKWKQ